MTTPTEAPKPHPSYPAPIIRLAKKHGLDPKIIQQMVEQGLLKVD